MDNPVSTITVWRKKAKMVSSNRPTATGGICPSASRIMRRMPANLWRLKPPLPALLLVFLTRDLTIELVLKPQNGITSSFTRPYPFNFRCLTTTLNPTQLNKLFAASLVLEVSQAAIPAAVIPESQPPNYRASYHSCHFINSRPPIPLCFVLASGSSILQKFHSGPFHLSISSLAGNLRLRRVRSAQPPSRPRASSSASFPPK